MKPDFYIYIFSKQPNVENKSTYQRLGAWTVLLKSGSCVSGWYDESNLVGYACSKAIRMVFGLLWCLGTGSNRLQHGDGAQKCHPWRLYWCVDCFPLKVAVVWMKAWCVDWWRMQIVRGGGKGMRRDEKILVRWWLIRHRKCFSLWW